MSKTPSTSKHYTPRHLGRISRNAIATVDRIPWSGGRIAVSLECGEFTSLCPITGQPDFGAITVRYEPRDYLVETKSLKLFLLRYRERGLFNEALVAELADVLFRQIKPNWIHVTGCFKSRGGIALTVTAERPGSESHGAVNGVH